MKIRSDFVSNSSSSSFVLWGNSGDVKLFLQKFAEMFANTYIPYELENALEVYVNTTYRWYEDVVKALLPEDKAVSEINDHNKYLHSFPSGSSKLDLDEIAYDNIHIPLSDLSERHDMLLSVADKISSLYIESQDNCSTSDLDQLRKMYSFCKDLDCCPDCSVSERDFLSMDDDDHVTRKMKQLHDIKTRHTGDTI